MTTSFTHNHPPAVINIVSGVDAAHRTAIPCAFQNMEGKHLIVSSRDKVPLFTAVSVEYNDALFLGEIMNCSPQADQGWQVEIKVEQILTGLQTLMVLRARLLGEGVESRARESVGVAA